MLWPNRIAEGSEVRSAYICFIVNFKATAVDAIEMFATPVC
jgi:hypothetical protein